MSLQMAVVGVPFSKSPEKALSLQNGRHRGVVDKQGDGKQSPGNTG